jgi:uroporphyrinogen-III synthase
VATLEAAGAVVDPVTVYHTVPAAIDSAHRAALATGVDAITFTSPSTVRNFVAALGPEAVGILRRTVVASIGPVTSEAVTDLGLPAPLEAPEATTTGLVAALEAHFS